MINLNKSDETIIKSQRDQKIAKESHHQINETIITKFGIRSLRISIISIVLMKEEWTKNSRKTNH